MDFKEYVELDEMNVSTQRALQGNTSTQRRRKGGPSQQRARLAAFKKRPEKNTSTLRTQSGNTTTQGVAGRKFRPAEVGEHSLQRKTTIGVG